MRLPLFILLLALAAHAGVAVGRDGAILRGADLVVDAEGGRLTAGKTTHALDGFYLVESDDGTLLWASDLTARLRGYEFLAREEVRERAAELALRAIKARDAEVARDLLDLAERNGLVGKEALRVEERVARLEIRGGQGPTSDAARVRSAAAGLDALHAKLLVSRARRERANGGDGLEVLRAALAAAPDLPSALALLEEAKPDGFELGDGRVWLDWRLEVEARGGQALPGDNLDLKNARKFWRPDAHGIECGPILMVTGVRNGVVAGRALAVGLLADRALASLFSSFPVLRQQPRPLRIFLYSSREEYLSKSGTARRYENPASLEWTAGHFSPSEGLSRFFWDPHPDAERRLLGACVHELTHHWLRERNPAYALKDIRRRADTPGFWIVEGFATFLEEGTFDLDRQSWELFNQRSRSLDMMQALERSSPGSLIPWSRLYALSQSEFLALDRERRAACSRRWSLGFVKLSQARIFYEQSAATCQYLFHAEQGKHRQALLQYVIDYYMGKADRMDPAGAFGMSAEELGSRVAAFAKAVARGWRPSK